MGSESRSSIEVLASAPALVSTPPVQKSWNAGAAFAIGGVLVAAVLYSASFDSLAVAWGDTLNRTYTHGYLVAAISIGLLFWRRRELCAAPVEVQPIAALPLALLAFVWLVGLLAPIQILHQVMLPLILWLTVYALAGRYVARICTFALAYLYFAIPIWDYAVNALQGMSIVAVRALLRVTSVPAYFQGEIVEIPAGIFQIEDGCSGLHYMIVALALAALHGEVNRCSRSARVKLVALAILCALISNWMRIYVIILAGHLSQMRHYLVTIDHYYFGWVVFVAAMACFFFIGARWMPPADVQAVSNGVPAGSVAPRVGARLIVLLALCAAPAWYLLTQSFERPVVHARLPERTPEWAGPWPVRGELQLFGAADEHRHARYARGEREIDVSIAAYAEQSIGKKISGYGAADHDSSESVTQSGRVVRIAKRSYAETEVSTATGATWLIWTRYDIGTRTFARATMAQLWYGVESLFAMRAVRVTSLRTRCESNCAEARDDLAQFARTVLDQ